MCADAIAEEGRKVLQCERKAGANDLTPLEHPRKSSSICSNSCVTDQ